LGLPACGIKHCALSSKKRKDRIAHEAGWRTAENSKTRLHGSFNVPQERTGRNCSNNYDPAIPIQQFRSSNSENCR
jgi:hypothetical protein